MKTRGRLTGVQVPFRSEKVLLTFEVDARPEDAEAFRQYEDLDIVFDKHREKRGNQANSLLWACLGEIAAALRTDAWSVYLYMLERYGRYTTVLVKAEAVEGLQRVWRETRVVGEQDGMAEVLCYYGSSTYDSAEFSRLLDGVVGEMKELRLPPPPSREMQAALAEIARREAKEREAKG